MSNIGIDFWIKGGGYKHSYLPAVPRIGETVTMDEENWYVVDVIWKPALGGFDPPKVSVYLGDWRV